MTITIVLDTAVSIPITITIISFFWAIVLVGRDDRGGMFSGLENLLACVPASIISMIAWIIYATFK